MSSYGNTPGHDRSDDAAAYVLGALEPGEAKAYRRHLEECETCREEVSALQGVANALPMAAPQFRSPSGLRQRVLAEVGAEHRPQRLTRRRGWPSGSWLPRPALASALAVVLVVAAVGAAVLLASGSSQPRITQADVIGSAGTAQVRVASGRAELIVRHFPPPPAGRIYEVWLKRPDRPPAPTNTLFTVTRTGEGDVGVVGQLRGVDEIMVTAEPAGGSSVPTRSPVIVARLS